MWSYRSRVPHRRLGKSALASLPKRLRVSRTKSTLRGLLDIGRRAGCLAVGLAMVNFDFADTFSRVDRLLAELGLIHTNGNQRSVHRVPRPIRRAVNLLFDRRQHLLGIAVAD